MKRLNDLSPFQNVLPYASEPFAVYQPLLGWKSRKNLQRFKRAMEVAKNAFYPELLRNIQSKVDFKPVNAAGDNRFLWHTHRTSNFLSVFPIFK